MPMPYLEIGGGLAAFMGAALIYERRNPSMSRQAEKDMRYIRILPHSGTEISTDLIHRMTEQFAGYIRTKSDRARKGREWFRYLIHRDEQGIAFYFGYPQDRHTGVDKAWDSAYPMCERHPVKHEDVPLPNPKGGYGGQFILQERGEREGLPLRSFDSRRDELGEVLLFMEPDTWLDLVFSPSSPAELKRLVKKAHTSIRPTAPGPRGSQTWLDISKAALSEFDPRNSKGKQSKSQASKSPRISDLDPDEQVQLKSLLQRFTGRERVFNVSLSIWSEHEYASSVTQSLSARLESMVGQDNGIHLKRSRFSPIAKIAPVPTRSMVWTASEMANLFHIPDGGHRIMDHIPHLSGGQRSLKRNELAEGIAIGKLQHPLQQGRNVAISYEQFTKHFLLSGMTGSGKSSTAVQMCQSLIDEWIKDPDRSPGFSYMDPARETAATILTRLLKAELDGKYVPWEKVHYAYLGPSDYPLGLNLLHHEPGETIDAVAKEVLGLLKYAYAGDTPRMDRLVENALLTLLEDRRKHTILGIVPVLTNEDFRNRILPHVEDPIVRQFWEREVQQAGIDPILNRLSPLLTNKTMRRMFGQAKWSLDLRKYMEEGHIFLWDLLRVSEQNIKLAVGHLITQYHQVAMTRRTGAKPHILMIDEAHLVQIPVMQQIIAVDRKFGLSLGLITQYIGQFQPWLVDAITENVGTILTCTQGADSASVVSSLTGGAFDRSFLRSLPERTVAVYTKAKNEAGRSEVTTFLAESDPPYIHLPDGTAANHRNLAEMEAAVNFGLAKGSELQARDGTPSALVDEMIDDYLSMRPVREEYVQQVRIETQHRGPWDWDDDDQKSSTATQSNTPAVRERRIWEV